MDPNAPKTTHNFPPFFSVYEDGRIERYWPSTTIPPSLDPKTGVEFYDVTISQDTNQKARVFKPRMNNLDQKKLPVVVHYHGGGFCIGSAFGPTTTTFLTSLVSKSGVIAVSIGYRLAPENPLPIAYEDAWSGLQWISSHSSGHGSDEWLNKHADTDQVFLIGESAGANLAHYVAVQGGVMGLASAKPRGLILVHPYFADKKPDEMIKYLYPGSSGSEDDPKLSPKSDPNVAKMACQEVLVHVAEKDLLKGRGLKYCEILKSSGWNGKLELVEDKNEDHCFHLFNPDGDNVGPLMQKLVGFIDKNSSS